MSLLWKIPLEGDEEGFLFTKMLLKQAKCNACQANIKLSNAGPTNLKVHLVKHPAYQKQFGVMDNAKEAKKVSIRRKPELCYPRNSLNDCNALSITSDIWSVLTENFVSLTAHVIDTVWKQHKFVLGVRHFPGCHNFETISQIMNNMLREWVINEAKRHVFLRDEESNMKKVKASTY
uniref:BED-type domain-containing protein n=1 Tax=Ditylenchus dipsaci TaxID=166011 RepID=A0A915DS61_9BILA